VTSVIWHATISLDGFVAGADGDLSWCRVAAARLPADWDLRPRLGALVAGRPGFDAGPGADGRGCWAEPWEGPVFVPACRPADRPVPGEVVFVAGVAEAVHRAREAAAGRDVVVTGGAVGSIALGLGLVDELMVHVVPVFLGRGIRVYPRTQRQAFVVLATAGSAERTSLRLRPRSPAVLG
jgi:dihydrofolate reductase